MRKREDNYSSRRSILIFVLIIISMIAVGLFIGLVYSLTIDNTKYVFVQVPNATIT